MSNPIKVFQADNQEGYWKVDAHKRIHANVAAGEATQFYAIQTGDQLVLQADPSLPLFVGVDLHRPGLTVYDGFDSRCVFGLQACVYNNQKYLLMLASTSLQILTVLGNDHSVVPQLAIDTTLSLNQNIQRLEGNPSELSKVCFDLDVS